MFDLQRLIDMSLQELQECGSCRCDHVLFLCLCTYILEFNHLFGYYFLSFLYFSSSFLLCLFFLSFSPSLSPLLNPDLPRLPPPLLSAQSFSVSFLLSLPHVCRTLLSPWVLSKLVARVPFASSARLPPVPRLCALLFVCARRRRNAVT